MLLDLEAFRAAPLTTEPFTFTVVKNAIRPADAAAIREDFPEIADSGLLPVEATRPGPAVPAVDRGDAERGGRARLLARNSASISSAARR